MIVKSFDIKKNIINNKFFLFYGENQGFKNQVIDEKFKKKYSDCTYSYEESEIFNKMGTFFINRLEVLCRTSASFGIFQRSLGLMG